MLSALSGIMKLSKRVAWHLCTSEKHWGKRMLCEPCAKDPERIGYIKRKRRRPFPRSPGCFPALLCHTGGECACRYDRHTHRTMEPPMTPSRPQPPSYQTWISSSSFSSWVWCEGSLSVWACLLFALWRLMLKRKNGVKMWWVSDILHKIYHALPI